jgi:cobalt-zinc-cadmium efflux system membrane fusion protein
VNDRTGWIAIAIAGFFAGAMVALAHEGHEPIPSKGASVDAKRGVIALSATSREILDVRTGEVVSMRHQDQIRTFATVESPWGRRAFAASMLPGRVAAIHVRSGERVEAGQLLAEVESRELELLHREHIDAARDLEYAKRVLELLGASRQTGAVPELRLFEAENAMLRAKNRLWVVEKKAAVLELPWRDEKHTATEQTGREHWGTFFVRSPISGTVLQQDAVIGQSVIPNTHLFQIVDNSQLWVRMHVLESDAHKLAEGMLVEVMLNAFPDRVWKSTIDTISQGIDPATQQIAAWCTLNSEAVHAGIQPGMTGRAVFYREAVNERLSVPRNAVWSDGLSHYVFVETASTKQGAEYERRLVWVDTERLANPPDSVQSDKNASDFVELTAGGLFSSDRVVTQGAHELAGLLSRSSLRLDNRTAKGFGIEFQRVATHPIDNVLAIDTQVDLLPMKRLRVAPSLSGTLKRVHVDRGQHVQAGTILAELASLEVVDLQLAWIESLLDYELQREMLQRLKTAAGSVSPRVLLDMQNSLEKIQSRAASEEHQLELIGFDASMLREISTRKTVFDAFPLRAPSDSLVIDFVGTTGDVISLGEDLFELHDPTGFQVIGFVPAKDSAKVVLDQRVRARFDAFPDRDFSGRVTAISPAVAKESGVRSIWIELDEMRDVLFRNRMLGRAFLTIGPGTESLAIPRTAIVREGLNAFVFVRGSDGTMERRRVMTGAEDDQHVAILGGLQLNEEVAVTQVMGLQTAHASIR